MCDEERKGGLGELAEDAAEKLEGAAGEIEKGLDGVLEKLDLPEKRETLKRKTRING